MEPKSPIPSKVLPDEKRRLRRDAVGIARCLINHDTIPEGASMLAEYRRKFGQSDDRFLKYELATLFIGDLLTKCCRHQSHQVSYLLDEHIVDCGSVDMERQLRGLEIAMYRRFRDKQGIERAVRALKALNQRKP